MKPVSPAPHHYQVLRARPSLLLAGSIALASLPALACAWAGTGRPLTSLQTTNAYWNCPTRTPRPTVSPVPTVCAEATGTPNAGGTPGPVELRCEDPQPTATPWPTVTPYGRWLSPQGRGSSNTFYVGQDVRIGNLKLTLHSYSRSQPIPNTNGQVAHIFTFHVHNEGSEPLNIQWPIQIFVREVERAGTVTAGNWWQTWRSEQAAGIPRWDPVMGELPGGQQKQVKVAIEAPDGDAHAVGFAPDPTNGQRRDELGNSAYVLWFVPQEDVYCPGENTSGPNVQGDGGAVYPRPLPATPVAQYGYFDGWPVSRGSAQVHLTQAFGCTAFPELSGFDCPNERPWFHSGVDLASAKGTPLLSVVEGIITYVGPSSGTRQCTFPGAEPPRYNLGWMVQLRVVDATGHPGPHTVKYGHAIAGSEQVQVGDHVRSGQVLARMGSTGCSTGPHLHFMVQDQSGRFLDPFNFIGSPRM
jgi:murein DD-endopeptidase MepM/ murein hydrolase activator NlpD